MIFSSLKAKAMILSLLAAFIVGVGASVSLTVMKLRMDIIESDHKSAVNVLAKQHADQITALRADHQGAVDKRTEEVRLEQAAITKRYEKALNDTQVRQAALRADLGSARAAARSLREQTSVAARRINLPDAPGVTIAEYAIATGELLAECSAALTELGEKADGHASDVHTLKDAWPVASR